MKSDSFGRVPRCCHGGRTRTPLGMTLAGITCAGLMISAGPVVEWIQIQPFPFQAPAGTLMHDGEAVVALCSIGVILHCALDGTWQRATAPTTNELRAGLYALDTFVAAGDRGSVATSIDGLEWHLRSTDTDANLVALVAAGPSLFALGEGGVLLRSTNGVAWSLQATPTSQTLRAAAHGNGTYVVVGDAGTVLTSTDGIEWTLQDTVTEEPFGNVAFGNGIFIAQGPHWVAVSEDGVQWSIQQPQGPDRDEPEITVRWTLRGLDFGSGLFVLSGDSWIEVRMSGTMQYTIPEVFVSADGNQWLQMDIFRDDHPFGSLGEVTHGNGVFVTPGPGGVYRSTNGFAWELVPGSPHAQIRFESGRFLRPDPWPSTSLNGVDWEELPRIPAPDPTRNLHEVVFANDRFVIAGAGVNLVSNDGLLWRWHFHESDLEPHGIVGGNAVFVAVSTNGSLLNSTDGLEWRSSTTSPPAALTRVRSSGNQFIAVGKGGAIATSPNGRDWMHRESGVTSDLVDLATDGSQVIVVGDSATVLSSSDGAAWSPLTTPATGDLKSVAWGNGSWLILEPAVNRSLVRSTDREVWAKQTLAEMYFNTPLRFEGNRFWVVARGSAWPSASVLGSSDGIDWNFTPRDPQASWSVETGITDYVARTDMLAALASPGHGPDPGLPWYDGAIHVVSWADIGAEPEASAFPTAFELLSIAFGRGRFVAVGRSGIILASNLIEPILTLDTDPTTELLRLSLRGPSGKTLRLEFSSDLANWTPVGTFGNADPPLTFELPSEPGAAHGFYRAVQEP